jgi:hypothetical protein
VAEALEKSRAAFIVFQRLGHRVAEVDQKTVVRQDLLRAEVIFLAGGANMK